MRLQKCFFFFFPPQETSENAPVVLYLEGTPGKNMFFSIFTQNGPFSMGPDGQLKLRRESWNNKHHMIYMDSMPGFGYTSGIERNHLMEVRLVSSLRSVLRTFFRIFSSIRQNPFFLAGNYYAWTYLPLLASALHDDKVQRPKSNSEINFKGIIIANGLVNTDEQFSFGDYLYITGLIDDNGKEQFEALERNFKLPTVKSDSKTFYHNFEQLIMGNNSLFKELTGYRHPYNILEDELPSTLNDSITHFIFSWITRLDVRRALHIGDEQKYHPLSQIALTNWKKFVNSGSFDKLSNTFQNDRVLIYTGNLDILCPYPSVERWLEKFSWPNKQEFTDAERIPWYDSSNELAGYIKKSQNIIEFVMINAGHYPCIDQPKRTLELVEGFTHDTL